MAKPRKKNQVEVSPPTISAAGSQSQSTGGNALVKKTPAWAKTPRRRPSPSRGGAAPKPQARRAPAAAPMPVDPMAPLSPAQMQQQAFQIAMSQLQPQLNGVNQESSAAQAAHDTRTQQIDNWAGQEQGNLNSAFTDTRDALNNLISLSGTNDQASQTALAAALRGGASSTDSAASMLGVASPTSVAPSLTASADSSKSAMLGAGAEAGSLLGFMGAQRALGPVAQAQNQEQERQRYNAVTQDLGGQKRDLLAQAPGLISASLKDQKDFALAQAQFGETKANNLFQQYLAGKELDLKKKDQTFQQWLATNQLGETVRSNKAGESQAATNQSQQNAVDWANIGINRIQAEGQLAQINADAAKEKDAKKKQELEARGTALSKAMEWLSGYMSPGKDEASSSNGNYPYGKGTPQATVDDPETDIDETKAPSTKTYQRLFNDALRGMTQYTTRSDALRILMKSEYPDWRRKAKSEYNRLKRRKTSAQSYPVKGGKGAGQ